MLLRKMLQMLWKADPRVLLLDTFDGSELNTNLWTKPDTYPTTELVTNGTFPSDITGWTDASDASNSISWSVDHMVLTSDNVGTVRARQSITTIANLSYTLSFDLGVGNLTYKIGTLAGGSQIATALVNLGTTSVTFTATGATTWLEFSGSFVTPRTLDNVSVLPTSGLVTVTGGNLVFAGGKAAPTWADPALVSKAPHFWNRVAGLTIEWQITPTLNSTYLAGGFSDGTLGSDPRLEPHGFEFRGGDAAGNLSIIRGIATYLLIPFSYTAASLWGRIVCLAAGALYYISTDNRVTWSLIWIDATVTTSPLYAFIESYNAALTAASCQVSQSTAKPATLSTTPAAPTPTLGAELFTDTGMETWTSSTDLTSWTETLAGTSTVNQESTVVHGGTYAARLDVDGSNSVVQVAQTVTALAGAWLQISAWLRSSAAGKTTEITDGGADTVPRDPGTTWTQYTQTRRATAANPAIGFKRYAATSASVYGDDFSAKVMTLSTLVTLAGNAGTRNGVFDCAPTTALGYQTGIMTHLDDETNPQNYLHIFVDRAQDGTKAYLLKVVSGTTTELTSGTVTYSAAAQLRLVSNGNSHAIYYNGTQVGTTQTVTMPGAFGTKVAGFQTSASDSVGTVAVNA